MLLAFVTPNSVVRAGDIGVVFAFQDLCSANSTNRGSSRARYSNCIAVDCKWRAKLGEKDKPCTIYVIIRDESSQKYLQTGYYFQHQHPAGLPTDVTVMISSALHLPIIVKIPPTESISSLPAFAMQERAEETTCTAMV